MGIEAKAEASKSKDIQSLIFKISDALFLHRLTVWDILNRGTQEQPGCKIIDKTIDGREYQLIRREYLFDCFETLGFTLSLSDRQWLKTVFTPLISDLVNVDIVVKTFEILGIREDVPQVCKSMNFDTLTGSAIRVINKILKYMNENNILDIHMLVEPCELKAVTVVSKKGEWKVETVALSDFETFLKQKKIIDYSEHLDDRLVELFQLSNDHDDMLVVKKIEKVLNKVNYHIFWTVMKSSL